MASSVPPSVGHLKKPLTSSRCANSMRTNARGRASPRGSRTCGMRIEDLRNQVEVVFVLLHPRSSIQAVLGRGTSANRRVTVHGAHRPHRPALAAHAVHPTSPDTRWTSTPLLPRRLRSDARGGDQEDPPPSRRPERGRQSWYALWLVSFLAVTPSDPRSPSRAVASRVCILPLRAMDHLDVGETGRDRAPCVRRRVVAGPPARVPLAGQRRRVISQTCDIGPVQNARMAPLPERPSRGQGAGTWTLASG
jgi:hypothetical protein